MGQPSGKPAPTRTGATGKTTYLTTATQPSRKSVPQREAREIGPSVKPDKIIIDSGPTPTTPKVTSNLSPVYAAMGLNVAADTSSKKWDTEPIRVYDGNKVYVNPVFKYFYILGSDGQVAQYQYRTKRLAIYGDQSEQQATKYPSWFDKDTIKFIDSMGGLK